MSSCSSVGLTTRSGTATSNSSSQSSGTTLTGRQMLPTVPPSFKGDVRSFPYHVSDGGGGPGLAKVSPRRFHVWRDGVLGSILPTESAILVSRDVGDFLAAEANRAWRTETVTVFDPPATEIHDY